MRAVAYRKPGMCDEFIPMLILCGFHNTMSFHVGSLQKLLTLCEGSCPSHSEMSKSPCTSPCLWMFCSTRPPGLGPLHFRSAMIELSCLSRNDQQKVRKDSHLALWTRRSRCLESSNFALLGTRSKRGRSCSGARSATGGRSDRSGRAA